MSAPTKVVQKCQECGGNLVFHSTKNGLLCERCGNFVPVTGTLTTEKSFQDLLKNAPTWQKDTVITRCEHCGAKSVVAKFDLVAECEYCGTSNVVKTEEAPGLQPDTIVLFDLNRDEACQQVSNWLSKRFFVPSEFKKQFKERQLSGIYYPVFTFDADVTARYAGTLVQTNSMTVTIDGQETTRTQTTRRVVNDVLNHSFDDALVVANEELTPEILNKLQNFDTNHGQAFQQSYLTGFTVCQSSKDPQACWNEAKQAMERVIRDKIAARYRTGNTTLEDLSLDIEYKNITYKYALLPVYVGHIEFDGVKYPLYVNGQTGKIHGKTPKSWWKIFFTFATLGAAFFGLGIFLAMFL